MDVIWTVLLMIILYNDGREKRIPDKFTVSVFLCALFQMIIFETPGITEALTGGACAGAVFFFILLWKPGVFGGGDVKLSIANGMYLGAEKCFYSFAAAVFLAGIYVVTGIVLKKINRKSEIAFGPFLCAGALFANYLL